MAAGIGAAGVGVDDAGDGRALVGEGSGEEGAPLVRGLVRARRQGGQAGEAMEARRGEEAEHDYRDGAEDEGIDDGDYDDEEENGGRHG